LFSLVRAGAGCLFLFSIPRLSFDCAPNAAYAVKSSTSMQLVPTEKKEIEWDEHAWVWPGVHQVPCQPLTGRQAYADRGPVGWPAVIEALSAVRLPTAFYRLSGCRQHPIITILTIQLLELKKNQFRRAFMSSLACRHPNANASSFLFLGRVHFLQELKIFPLPPITSNL
jgi:hypothetical protein